MLNAALYTYVVTNNLINQNLGRRLLYMVMGVNYEKSNDASLCKREYRGCRAILKSF